VLLHDPDLVRTAGSDVPVYDRTLSQLQSYSVGEQGRFGGRYREARIPSLAEFAGFLQQRPGLQAFVEIKRGSLQRFGHDKVLDAVWHDLRAVRGQAIIISFDREAVAATRRVGAYRTGWAIRSMDERARQHAVQLAPDFLFFSTRLLPPPDVPLWRGVWQWVIYSVDDPEQALQCSRRGITLVETNAIGEMLSHPALSRKICRHAV
jgi:glycerophosphoryl diester phosphodiesterase